MSAQVRQQRVGTLLGDDPFERFNGERLDIGNIRHPRIGHDGGRIRVDQDDAIPQGAEGLACLRTGVVEFAGLTDHDRA